MESYQTLFKQMLSDWDMMQTTAGDEGAECAERFERHFYDFIQALKDQFSSIAPRPRSIDEAEDHPDIVKLLDELPDPLYIPFINELELIVLGEGFELSD